MAFSLLILFGVLSSLLQLRNLVQPLSTSRDHQSAPFSSDPG